MNIANTQLNIRSINNRLTDLFQRYIISVGKVNGMSGLFVDDTQIHLLSDDEGLSIPYNQGELVVSNSIDNMQFLLAHKRDVAKALKGVEKQDIYANRRNLNKVHEYLAKIDGKYELGNQSEQIQLFISRTNNNMVGISSQNSWLDYIMTQSWIDKLSNSTIDSTSLINDYRIEYLADTMENMLKEHEVNLHEQFEQFNEDEYLNNGNNNPGIEALNKLNSISKLSFGFYEMFKPIGGTKDKYIKVRVDSDGTMDIQGVVGLTDCEHVHWEYGSKEYLRSLNTGNQRYDFKLTLPFNDQNSSLWWKPDNPELISPIADKEDDSSEDDSDQNDDDIINIEPIDNTKIANALKSAFDSNYNKYSDSWDNDVKNMLSSQIEQLKQSTNSSRDAEDDEVTLDFGNSTLVQPLVPSEENEDEEEPKYRYYKEYELERFIRWFGSNFIPPIDLSSISKKTICSIPQLSNDVQATDFYENSDNILNNMDLTKVNMDESTSISLLSLAPKSTIDIVENEDGEQFARFVVSGHQQTSNIAFHIVGKMMDDQIQSLNRYGSSLTTLSNTLIGLAKIVLFFTIIQQKYTTIKNDIIPSQTKTVRDLLFNILSKPLTPMMLMRLRQIDLDALKQILASEIQECNEMLKKYSIDEDEIESIKQFIQSYKPNEPVSNVQPSIFAATKTELDKYYNSHLFELLQNIDYSDITVDDIRNTITTYNNLVVRLPIEDINKITALNIFKDWKNYVDNALAYLVQEDKLFRKDIHAKDVPDDQKWMVTGTDGKEYDFTEYYIDYEMTTPLIDYSYRVDANGNVTHDRWDFWSESDFK